MRCTTHREQATGGLGFTEQFSCVDQLPGGIVADVQFVNCPGTAAYKRSVELAVYKADPLPPPPDPELFDRQIEITFYPEN